MHLRVLLGCPSFAFEPRDATTEAFGRKYVFFIAIANHQHLIGWKPEGINTQLEYAGIRLTHANNGTFYD